MRQAYLRNTVVVLSIVGLIGCQSGPRWAWWKSDTTAPAETSLVARAAPTTTPVATATATLPSQQATPQTIAAQNAGATPAAQTAASTTTQGIPPVSVPASSAATLANAPIANYSATTAASPYSVTTNNTGSPAFPSTASAAATATKTSPPASIGVAPVGPYDPATYRGSSSTAAASATTEGATPDRYGSAAGSGSSATIDRYASTTTNSSVDRYNTSALAPIAAAPTSTPGVASTAGVVPGSPPVASANHATNSLLGNRYATPAVAATTATTELPPATNVTSNVVTTNTTSPAAVTTPAPVASIAESTAPPVSAANPLRSEPSDSTRQTTSAGAFPVASSSNVASSGGGVVNLVSSPGQYRPGGTSSYPSSSTSAEAPQIGVASRPTPPASQPDVTRYPNNYPATGAGDNNSTRY